MLCKYAPSFIQRLDAGRLEPGAFVTHVEDQAARGTVVAMPSTRKVVVLWAQAPWMEHVKVESKPILPPSPPRRAKWSMHQAEQSVYDVRGFGYLPQPRTFEGEEEYGPGELTSSQVKALVKDGGDVTYYQDGSVIVKRKAASPPDYLQKPDGSFRSTYYRH